VRPMVLDLPPDAPIDAVTARLRELHEAYRADYRAYYEQYADAASPPGQVLWRGVSRVTRDPLVVVRR
jgi:hypothetical protein